MENNPSCRSGAPEPARVSLESMRNAWLDAPTEEDWTDEVLDFGHAEHSPDFAVAASAEPIRLPRARRAASPVGPTWDAVDAPPKLPFVQPSITRPRPSVEPASVAVFDTLEDGPSVADEQWFAMHREPVAVAKAVALPAPPRVDRALFVLSTAALVGLVLAFLFVVVWL